MTVMEMPLVAATAMVCGPTIGFVLAAAAWHKLAEPDRFRQTIVDYRIVPAGTASLAAAFLVVAEGLVAAALLVSPWPRAAGFAAAGLLALYTAAIGVNLLRGRSDLECGCGFEPTPIGLGKVAANLGLVAVALVAAFAPSPEGVIVWISVRIVGLNAVIAITVLSALWRAGRRSVAIIGAAP